MSYDKIIDNNQNIRSEFKQIAKECFSNILETLGKNNFKRWIHTRNLSKDIKTLIFDWMNEEEKEKLVIAGGFYGSRENQIKIRGPENVKDTSIHEVYHFLTRNSNPFCTYINEGMTEYLKGMTSEIGPKAYMENVCTVSFLHKMLGDSLVKAYLLR